MHAFFCMQFSSQIITQSVIGVYKWVRINNESIVCDLGRLGRKQCFYENQRTILRITSTQTVTVIIQSFIVNTNLFEDVNNSNRSR